MTASYQVWQRHSRYIKKRFYKKLSKVIHSPRIWMKIKTWWKHSAKHCVRFRSEQRRCNNKSGSIYNQSNFFFIRIFNMNLMVTNINGGIWIWRRFCDNWYLDLKKEEKGQLIQNFIIVILSVTLFLNQYDCRHLCDQCYI